MRYLTHETEDNFWLSHGAKAHPLAQAEEEQRKLEQQQALELKPNQRVNFAEPDRISTSSKVSNGSSRSSESQGGVSPGSSVERNGDLHASTEQNGSLSSGDQAKKYIAMNDEEILKAQQHAKRVGYKVTEV